MKAWLNLCRWPNLLMVGLVQFLFKYAFLPAFGIASELNILDFCLLCISTILVTASGNIINDIYDVKTDFVNQRARPLPQQFISLSSAYKAYFLFNFLTVTSVLYLSLKFDVLSLAAIVVTVIIILFLYAKILKSIPLLGNIVVSILVSLSFLLVVYVELTINNQNQLSEELQHCIIGYGVFAFWTNLNREWIKDVIDIKGDYAQNISTLPILLGKSRMNMLIFSSTLFLVIALIAGVKVYFQPDLVFILYLTFGICVPLFYVLYHIHQKQLQVNYKMLSDLYKIIMLTGVLSLALFQL